MWHAMKDIQNQIDKVAIKCFRIYFLVQLQETLYGSGSARMESEPVGRVSILEHNELRNVTY